MPTEQEAGWEAELTWAFWSKEKSPSPASNKTMIPQLSNLWPTQYIDYAISALSDTCIH